MQPTEAPGCTLSDFNCSLCPLISQHRHNKPQPRPVTSLGAHLLHTTLLPANNNNYLPRAPQAQPPKRHPFSKLQPLLVVHTRLGRDLPPLLALVYHWAHPTGQAGEGCAGGQRQHSRTVPVHTCSLIL